MAGPPRPLTPDTTAIQSAERAATASLSHYLSITIFFILFAAPLFAVHLQLLKLPFFWDEQGQFIPTALDLLRTQSWVAHSAIPNVHPPGLEVYLVLWYKLFGYSIFITRVAMLVCAACGLLVTFLLAIELSRGTRGAPAFLPPLLLLASPLFFTQSMMAQLDMPAMTLTVLALWFFVRDRFPAAAAACIALVLTKETGIVVPLVFFVILASRRERRRASLFIVPALALGCWLLVLRQATGYWLGNPGFAHYNVEYSLQPVRITFCFVRRIYYVFFAEGRFIGTALIIFAFWRKGAFRSAGWVATSGVGAGTLALVSVFGGAELERYLLPVLPLFYIAVGVALTYVPLRAGLSATAALIACLIASVFWNPPYPVPYENNYALIDFVHLQQAAAHFVQDELPGARIATAWPLTASLKSPDYGYVRHPLPTVETNDFHLSSIRALSPSSFDTLITYTRTWAPDSGVIAWAPVREFLSRYYGWQPDITPDECAQLGLREAISFHIHDQEITVYVRDRMAAGAVL